MGSSPPLCLTEAASANCKARSTTICLSALVTMRAHYTRSFSARPLDWLFWAPTHPRGFDHQQKSSKSSKSAAKAPVKAKRAKRAKKDPNKPKGAMSAFMQFSQKERPKVKEEHPDMKITEISKVLGLRWGKMDEAQKKPYQKKADADKERYKKDMEAYNAKKAAEEEEEEDDDEEEEEEDSD
eukprot:jgi/Undpi1/14194/HiC_scaffold_9.g03843.m1